MYMSRFSQEKGSHAVISHHNVLRMIWKIEKTCGFSRASEKEKVCDEIKEVGLGKHYHTVAGRR